MMAVAAGAAVLLVWPSDRRAPLRGADPGPQAPTDAPGATGAADAALRAPLRGADYVGAEACGACHSLEYKAWAGSSHARSFVALQTATARKVSEEPKAYAGMPSEKMMKECSPCHAPGMDIPARERPRGFHPEDGVQCESCHGPGGHYAKDEVMRDGASRKAAGLGKLRKEECLRCHELRPSHAILGKPAFAHEKMWARIAHRNSAKPTETK